MKPLPEEKLLRLIRGKARASPAAAIAQAAGASVNVVALPLARAHTRLRFGTRLLIIGLGGLLLMEFVLLIVQALRPPPTVTMLEPPHVPGELAADGEAPLPLMPSLAQSVSRPLFSPPADVPGSSASGPRPAPSGSATRLASRLTLLGVIAGNPAQAIIEDSQTKKTYFVSPGQVLVEGAVVDQIVDNRVILDLQGEKIELAL